MIEKYYTREQLDALNERAQALGQEGLQRAEADWKELLEQVRAEMNKGTDPASEPVQQLARRWRALIEAFTGGDPGIAKSLQTMYEQEGPEKASRIPKGARVRTTGLLCGLSAGTYPEDRGWGIVDGGW